MLYWCYKISCTRINRWIMHLDMHLSSRFATSYCASRIFNVVGAIIDRYLGFSLSSQFNILIPMDLGMFIESNGYMEQYAYTLCYLNASNYAFFRQQCLNSLIIKTDLCTELLQPLSLISIGSFIAAVCTCNTLLTNLCLYGINKHLYL